jgi:formamidopyrimidine-DNA glycosylase
MPEVCEVCLTSQYLNSIIDDSITKINTLSGRYKKHEIRGLNQLIFPLKICEIHTKGKFLWFVLMHDKQPFYMLNTFGLTGKWSFDELDHSNVEFIIKSTTKTYKIYFSDTRNFGTIEFTKNIDILNKKLDKLAPDFLQTDFTDEDFYQNIKNYKNKKKDINTVLMSQEKNKGVGSGLGNYLVPEILYRAKISPYRTIDSLSKRDIIVLSTTIKHVLKLCYLSNQTQYISHLNKFLEKHKKMVDDGVFPNHHKNVKIGKEKFQFKVYRRKYDDDDHPVVGDKIIEGRTTYWVPDVQK